MDDESKRTCLDCKYYTDRFGNGDYCKLYRHSINNRELICSRFERRKKIDAATVKKTAYNQKRDMSLTEKSDSDKEPVKNTKEELRDVLRSLHAGTPRNKRIWFVAGSFSCVVVLTILLIFGVVLVGAIFSSDKIGFTLTIAISALLLAVILGLSLLLLTLVRKSKKACIIISGITASLVIFMLIRYNMLWFGYLVIIDRFIEFISKIQL